jgi:hypothetical protein
MLEKAKKKRPGESGKPDHLGVPKMDFLLSGS